MGEAFITRRGGGAPLNFKVVGGTKPSNPKENTIWVSNPNLLDFNNWANNIFVNSGTKSVSGNAITLTANANDCHTTWGTVDTSAVIPCEAGKTYVFEWNHSGGTGYVYLFPNASVENLVMVDARGGKIEYTATEGVTFFTFRVGVMEANSTATYSNIRISEKMAEITGWHFGAEEPQFNYLPYPYHSGEKLVTNGITFTVNADKSITVNGTAQGGRADFTLYNGQIKAGKYKLSSSLGLNGPDGISVWSYDDSASLGYLSGGGAVDFAVTKECYGNVTLIVNEGSSYNNITIHPKLVGYEEGALWIQTGTTSPVAMNVLKKNSIQVCPLTAKQYIGGEWVLVDAETYQGGKWNDWAYWIIGNGADGLGITGGFTSAYENQWSFADDGSLTFYKDIDNMYSSFNVPSKRTLDVTNYNSMTIKVSSFSRNASYIGVNAPSNLGKDSTCRVKISAAGTYTLDISAISGEVHLQADLDYNGVTMVVSELYFS